MRVLHPVCRALLILLSLLLGACANQRITVPVSTTLAQTVPLQTLPPTWTPTATFTPAPTRAPSATTTAIPTLSSQELCDQFMLLAAPDTEIQPDSVATFAWKGVPTSAPMKLYITERGSRAGLLVDVPIPGDNILRIPAARLPDSRQLDWKAWLQDPLYGAICTHSGSFTRRVVLTF
ncbi:MAG: hypothetical protein ABI947_03225 [Chloroflexota bacterium]